MDVQITGRNIEITDAIRDYVLKRMDRLDKYLSVVVDAHVTLYVEKIFHSVVITVRKRRLTLHAEERSEDLYSSIDKAVDKLVTQLRRHKDRIKSHNSRHRQGPDYGDGPDLNLQVDVLDGLDLEAATDAPRVIHTQRFALKPMSVDEAVLQMDLMNQDFLVFSNQVSLGVNVLYRRKDGNYGLIVPGAVE